MSPSRPSVFLLAGLCLALTASVCQAGTPDPDDMFGDLTRSQQGPTFDDSAFQQALQQEFQDFYNPQKHDKPVRSRSRTYPGSYRFIESDFDVFWDTVSFRSSEAQGEGAALVTLMFKDVVVFDPSRRAEQFSVNRFVDTALASCGSVRSGSSGKGSTGKGGGKADGGFAGFDGPADAAAGLALFDAFKDSSGVVAGSASYYDPDLPVALLIHRDGSASDMFPYAFKGAPKGRIFGPAPTSGAFSTFYNLDPWGPLSLQFASGDTIGFDGQPLIGHGAAPDVVVLQKQSDLLAGKDSLHEAALAWVRQELKP